MVGNAKKLLDDKYGDDELLCKYGCTDDLPRRSAEHHKKFNKEFKTEIELVYFSIIEAKYIFNTETNIKQYFKSNLVEHKNMSELIVINKKDLGQIKQHYSMIQNNYIGKYEEMNEKIKQLEKEIIEYKNKIILQNKEIEIIKDKHKIETLELQHKNKLIEEQYKKELQEEKHKNEITEERHKIELQSKEIELLNQKLELLSKK